MTTIDQVSQALGQYGAEIHAMQAQLSALVTEMKTTNVRLAALEQIESERKGALKVWVSIAAFSGSGITLLGELLLNHFNVWQ